jgi:hypothetical protein
VAASPHRLWPFSYSRVIAIYNVVDPLAVSHPDAASQEGSRWLQRGYIQPHVGLSSVDCEGAWAESLPCCSSMRRVCPRPESRSSGAIWSERAAAEVRVEEEQRDQRRMCRFRTPLNVRERAQRRGGTGCQHPKAASRQGQLSGKLFPR